MRNLFIDESANVNNPKWEKMISRNSYLYSRNNDLRSEFYRDYTRIIHSKAYKRLKHKTQVFFSPENDHICTRAEHVSHVESISYTISKYLGLNLELTQAISISHDIGHSPFGHQGEKILSEISKRDLGYCFWHEKNGLDIVDFIELLEDDKGFKNNLNLTYAVRDGIISHCGEIDENNIRPRDKFINLDQYTKPNEFYPYTWEGCVVKIADKISYICRDIEDAITLNILNEHLDDLYNLLEFGYNKKINNTTIINTLIYDLCTNSSLKNGLCFSDYCINLLNKIKSFNYKNIYLSQRLQPSNKYFNLIINDIYDILKNTFDGINTIKNLDKLLTYYPKLINSFKNWIYRYYNLPYRENDKLKNQIIFDITQKKDFYRGILYFISGMTDNFAIEIYNEIIRF